MSSVPGIASGLRTVLTVTRRTPKGLAFGAFGLQCAAMGQIGAGPHSLNRTDVSCGRPKIWIREKTPSNLDKAKSARCSSQN